MAYLEELLPEFRKGAKIRRKSWRNGNYIYLTASTIKCFYGMETLIIRDDILSNDWELYQEDINIEVGECYRTKNGGKAFISSKLSEDSFKGTLKGAYTMYHWDKKGNHESSRDLDIVDKWSDDDVAED